MRVVMAAEYAMRTVLYLSANYGRVVPRREISEAMDVPSQFLVKIAHDLARRNIIGITQGRRGGYWLKLSPDKITVLDVFEATAGDIVLSPCIEMPEFCKNSDTCALREVWKEANEKLKEVFAKYTFKDLLERTPYLKNISTKN